jgi:hypothetical protein
MRQMALPRGESGADHRIVWAGVEIDGVFRNLDGEDTWTHLETGLYDPDI